MAPTILFSTGEEALEAVGDQRGSWNWALVGADPEELPLAGGGPGGLEELRECIARQEDANVYGILRLAFGSGRRGRKKYIFLHASRVDDNDESKVSSPVQQGQALAQNGAMERALSAFANFQVRIQATSVEDLTLESILEKLKQASTADADLLTEESYKEALAADSKETHKEEAPQEIFDLMQKMASVAAEEIFLEACIPESEVKAREVEPMETGDFGTPLLKAIDESLFSGEDNSSCGLNSISTVLKEDSATGVRSYEKGDLVVVFSRCNGGQWFDDGTIHEILEKDSVVDECNLKGGSVKVLYNNNTTFKWVLPTQFSQLLRPSRRPVPPCALVGQLLKETHNFLTQWHVRHFEMNKGYLQWWMDPEEAKQGKKPQKTLCLLGLDLQRKGSCFYVKTQSSKGTVFTFDATSESSAETWCKLLLEHQEYCQKMRDYLSRSSVQVLSDDENSPTVKEIDRYALLAGERSKSRFSIVKGKFGLKTSSAKHNNNTNNHNLA